MEDPQAGPHDHFHFRRVGRDVEVDAAGEARVLDGVDESDGLAEGVAYPVGVERGVGLLDPDR